MWLDAAYHFGLTPRDMDELRPRELADLGQAIKEIRADIAKERNK